MRLSYSVKAVSLGFLRYMCIVFIRLAFRALAYMDSSYDHGCKRPYTPCLFGRVDFKSNPCTPMLHFWLGI